MKGSERVSPMKVLGLPPLTNNAPSTDTNVALQQINEVTGYPRGRHPLQFKTSQTNVNH